MPAATAHPDADAILAWYDAVRRDLPWRRTRDPYAILVSEVMLQQTQVARVVPYYEAFLARFPDEAALAPAPVADVLRLWSGLGYNRRALALQAAAAAVARDGWPADVEGLLALPGVGPYTAAAVASFAFGEQAAAVDTNVRRVIERLDRRRRRPPELARRAERLMPGGRAADWNQALMELGRDCLHRARAAVRRLPRRGLSVARAAARRRPCASEPATACASRRPTAMCAAAWSPALVAGEGLPDGIAAERLERALAGLERDGLVVREGAAARLP